MNKKHCDRCDRVMGEGDCLFPSAAIVVLDSAFRASVTVEVSRPNIQTELCRSCEVVAAKAFIAEIEKNLP